MTTPSKYLLGSWLTKRGETNGVKSSDILIIAHMHKENNLKNGNSSIERCTPSSGKLVGFFLELLIRSCDL